MLKSVFEELCSRYGWAFTVKMGKQDVAPDHVDFVLFGHSIVSEKVLEGTHTGVHVIRDPRDIIVSGYLYHMRTTEAWCIHKDFDLSSPIDYPNVPFSQRHRSEEWKKHYIESLKGISYQENLKALSPDDGIVFEMKHYGRWTIESMMSWDYNASNILEVRFEEIMEDYGAAFKQIFVSLGLSGKQLGYAMDIAQKHNLKNKTEKELADLDHVYSRETSKWRGFFTEEHKKLFVQMFGDCLIELGYESSNRW